MEEPGHPLLHSPKALILKSQDKSRECSHNNTAISMVMEMTPKSTTGCRAVVLDLTQIPEKSAAFMASSLNLLQPSATGSMNVCSMCVLCWCVFTVHMMSACGMCGSMWHVHVGLCSMYSVVCVRVV